MSIGIFVDGKHKPTRKEIQEALGCGFELWEDLASHISEEYDVQGQLSFSGQKYGWELGFRKGGRPLADLYPGSGVFVAQIVLGRAATEKAAQLKMGPHVREVYDKARQLYDGMWLFIPVRSKRDVADVKLLIAAKVNAK